MLRTVTMTLALSLPWTFSPAEAQEKPGQQVQPTPQVSPQPAQAPAQAPAQQPIPAPGTSRQAHEALHGSLPIAGPGPGAPWQPAGQPQDASDYGNCCAPAAAPGGCSEGNGGGRRHRILGRWRNRRGGCG